MPDTAYEFNRMEAARLAGAFYLAIIVLGLWSEMFVRASLITPGDAAATAAAILDHEGLFRLSFAADTLMVMSDTALAVLLFLLFRPVSAPVALTAMVFRLLQASTLGFNLLNQQAALLTVQGGGDNAAERALRSLDLQAYGYDLGLIFFGVNCLLTGWLLIRSGWLPRIFGYGIVAAGAVYLIGSYLRFIAPAFSESFAVAYAVPLVAELGFCLWLLFRGLPER